MLKGKTIIVTGGSSGMGLAMAKQFVTEGANVVITGRDLERLTNAKEEIMQHGESVATFQMDVREIEHVQAMVKYTVETFGKIDGLVNNVPVATFKTMVNTATLSNKLRQSFRCDRISYNCCTRMFTQKNSRQHCNNSVAIQFTSVGQNSTCTVNVCIKNYAEIGT